MLIGNNIKYFHRVKYLQLLNYTLLATLRAI